MNQTAPKRFIEEEQERFDMPHSQGNNQPLPETAVVVKCPSCQTRFAIESDALRGQDNPRFHCSRCDNIFLLDEGQDPISAAHTHGPIAESSPFEVAPQPEEEEKVILSPYAPKSLDIPRSIDSGWSFSAPHETAEPAAPPAPAPEPGKKEGEPQIAFSFLDRQASSHPTKEFSAPTPPSKGTPIAAAAVERSREFTVKASQLWLESLGSLRAKLTPPAFRSLGVLIIPLLCCAAMLTALGYTFRAAPARAHALTAMIVPSLSHVAPPGVSFEQLQFRKATLDSGDTVYLISGKVANRSGQPLKSVEVEGLLFNDKGTLVTSKRTVAGAQINAAKMKALTLEAIQEIEEETARRGALVKDGDSIPFAVAIARREAPQVRHFTARIYSVKN